MRTTHALSREGLLAWLPWRTPLASDGAADVSPLQFTDVHGEVCPAGWKPGSKTMKADPKGSQARPRGGITSLSGVVAKGSLLTWESLPRFFQEYFATVK